MMEENMQENDQKLGLKAFDLSPEAGGTQVILAHKQVSPKEHLVFTHGTQPTGKLRCFKLTHEQGTSFHAEEYVSPELIADAARRMGIDEMEPSL